MKSSGAFAFSHRSSGVGRTLILLGIALFALSSLLLGCMPANHEDPAAQRANARANRQWAENDAVRAEGDAKADVELAKAEAEAIIIDAEARADAIVTEANTKAFLEEEPLRQDRAMLNTRLMLIESDAEQRRLITEQNAHQVRIMTNFVTLAVFTMPIFALILIGGGIFLIRESRKSDERFAEMQKSSERNLYSVIIALQRGKFFSVDEELEDVR